MTTSPVPLETITAALLDAARKAGADTADTVVLRGSSISIEVRGQALEMAERSDSTDLGLRVFVGQRQAVVSASGEGATAPDRVAQLAESAVAMARAAPEDKYAGIADPAQLSDIRDGKGLDLDDGGDMPAPDDLRDAAFAAEAAAMAVPGVTQSDSAHAGAGRYEMALAATNGFSGTFQRTSHSLYCTAIAGTGTGMERDGDGDARAHRGDLRGPADIGRIAGERAVALQGARRPKTGTYPVLFDERISSSLIGHLLSAANGAAVARGASWLKNNLGEQVLPAHLSVIEDPHRARIGGSRPFDSEGLPTARRAIVEDGVLTGWTLDLASARKLGMQSTGNAARAISGTPGPTNWNIALTQGDQSRADLIAQMGTGLLVTSMIGSTINPNTGDYSRGASGFWVENGEIVYPVNECTLAGNLREMLMRIVPANDARTYLSNVVPSLLIDGMTIAGQ
ncbi:TldD/PmbA family protein [Chachezhania antarctica]|uniref:TldD/PmbA family protein n=1 Tax=Chachezhania antarctica TaxID=2340860 RepID=UPI000EAD6E17|nr:TldD/PmbA family protein [Chachezhania antarctica]